MFVIDKKPKIMSRGIQENDGRQFTYIGTSKKKFVQRVLETHPNAESRVLGDKSPKKGQTVWEHRFDSFAGQLIDVRVEVHKEYGKQWNFEVDVTEDESDPEYFLLKMPYSSGYAKSILCRLPNLNFDEDVQFKWYDFLDQEKNKQISGISLKQSGKVVKSRFTREEKNGMPEMVKIMVKGEEQWDDSEKLVFLDKMVKDLKSKMKGSHVANPEENKPAEYVSNEDNAQAHEGESSQQEGDDDLPF